MAAKYVTLHVRMPPALHKRLQKDAARSGNSLNSEVVSQLEDVAEELDRILADYKQLRADHDQLAAGLEQMAKQMAETLRADLINAMVERAMKAAQGQSPDVPRESAPAKDQPAHAGN